MFASLSIYLLMACIMMLLVGWIYDVIDRRGAAGSPLVGSSFPGTVGPLGHATPSVGRHATAKPWAPRVRDAMIGSWTVNGLSR